MNLSHDHDTLRVTGAREFTESQVDDLIRDLRRALKPDHSAIEIDLAHTRGADSETVDALLALYEEFDRDGTTRTWRLRNPPPELRQLLELVRLHRLFEITPPRPVRTILV